MINFKIFQGLSSDLANISYHDGYVYFLNDTKQIAFDTENERKFINAVEAASLVDGDLAYTANDIKSRVLVSEERPEDLNSNDVWMHIVD